MLLLDLVFDRSKELSILPTLALSVIMLTKSCFKGCYLDLYKSGKCLVYSFLIETVSFDVGLAERSTILIGVSFLPSFARPFYGLGKRKLGIRPPSRES